MADRAHERVEELLNQYQGAVIDRDTKKELQNITMTAANKIGMLDLPLVPE